MCIRSSLQLCSGHKSQIKQIWEWQRCKVRGRNQSVVRLTYDDCVSTAVLSFDKYAQNKHIFIFSHLKSKHFSLTCRLGRVSHRVAMSLCLCLPFYFVMMLLSASVKSVSVRRMRNWFILGFWIFANQSPLHNAKVSREIICGLMSWAFSIFTGDIFCLFWCWFYYLHTLRNSVLPVWKIFCA